MSTTTAVARTHRPMPPSLCLAMAGVVAVLGLAGCAGPRSIPSAEFWAIPSPVVATAAVPTFTRPPTPPPTPTPTFVATGSMTVPRMNATATLLPNGKVLIAGGYQYSTAAVRILASAELYDPSTGTFAPTGSMIMARAEHTATLLADGRVLVAGGYGCGQPKTCDPQDTALSAAQQLTSAEIYDPKTGKFSRTGSMTSGRIDAAAARLNDGRVLIVGGYGAWADLYTPTTGRFVRVGPGFDILDGNPTATLLGNGKVLVTGDSNEIRPELFDPETGKFVSISFGFDGTTFPQSATPLRDGRVLLYSGELTIYDPVTGSFTRSGSIATGLCSDPTATALATGGVLFAGGWVLDGGNSVSVPSASLYDPATGLRQIGPMSTPRLGHTATLLSDGNVLIAGGTADGSDALSSAELFEP